MRYILSQMPIFLNLVFDIWFVREYSREPNLNPISSYNLTFFSHFLSVFLIWPLVYLFILLQYFCVHFFSLFLSCWLFVFCCTTKKTALCVEKETVKLFTVNKNDVKLHFIDYLHYNTKRSERRVKRKKLRNGTEFGFFSFSLVRVRCERCSTSVSSSFSTNSFLI